MLQHARGRASRAATRDPAFVSPTGRPALASFDVLTGGQRPGQGVSELIDFRHVQLVRQRQYQRRTYGLSRACMRSARAARLKLCRLHRTCAVRMRGLGYVPIARRAVGKRSIVRSEGCWGMLTTMPRRAPLHPESSSPRADPRLEAKRLCRVTVPGTPRSCPGHAACQPYTRKGAM